MDNNSNYDNVQNYDVTKKPKKKYGLISMTLGVLSVLFVCGLHLPLGIAALIFANKYLKQNGAFKGTALTGFITGVIGIVLGSCQLYWLLGYVAKSFIFVLFWLLYFIFIFIIGTLGMSA